MRSPPIRVRVPPPPAARADISDRRSFDEALAITAAAKARFPDAPDDVYQRGRRLVVESIQCGVTAMRAHVEVDRTVGLCCLDVAVRLKREFAAACDVQIAVFAQDPLFDHEGDEAPGENYALLDQAAQHPAVSAVGSAPYVERTPAQADQNVALILSLAAARGLLADLHIDYNVRAAAPPLIHAVLAHMDRLRWSAARGAVALGHATRYSLFTAAEWADLRAAVGARAVAFVALPQSDLYMMGRPADASRLAPRGTLPVPYMAARGFAVALGVNNVGNAFTPQGSVDPLALCPLGVAVYQDATDATCDTLLVRRLLPHFAGFYNLIDSGASRRTPRLLSASARRTRACAYASATPPTSCCCTGRHPCAPRCSARPTSARRSAGAWSRARAARRSRRAEHAVQAS
ncbi:Metallo-dependent hydrolase [Auriscalpium vulgare]|uniref:Metallo-dependent hydrolase n=1 Tax=Auriscalpium vulgare TaxID=40419 RepID=A0ACB8RLM8_9AGAM|nr:Metallo-dependent hydrolase [Auriscalpium vulgare]